MGRFGTVQQRFYYFDFRTTIKFIPELKNTKIMNFETIRIFFVLLISKN
jgi:hypothetical protein